MENIKKSRSILVVDDDPDLLDLVAYIFETKGFQVFRASSGKAAYEIVQKTQLDMVVSDVKMPNGTGIELLDWIRTNHPDIPMVVLMTGFADEKREEILKKGAKAVIDKPFEKDELIDTINKLLDSQ